MNGKNTTPYFQFQFLLLGICIGFSATAQVPFRQHAGTWAPVDTRQGNSLPAFDTLRTLLIPVVYQQEINESEYWPIASATPPVFVQQLFAPTFDSMQPGSITAYFLEASLGRFVFLGDCLPQVIRVDSGLDWYQGHGGSEQMVYDILDKVTRNNLVDWSRYDNWGKRNGEWVKKPDGVVDNVIILFREDASLVPPGYHFTGTGGGIAALLCRNYAVSPTLSITGTSLGSGLLVHKGRDFPPRVRKLVKHELAHFFTVNHYAGLNGFYGTDFTLHGAWGLAAAHGSSSVAVNAWDRVEMGWTRYLYDLDAATDRDTVIELYDFITTGESARIKLPYVDDEYFLLEYHANKGWFDRVDGGSTGLFIMHQSGTAENHLDLEEADGRWDFVMSDSLTSFEPCCGEQPMIKRLDENPLLGFGDRDDIRVLKNKGEARLTQDNLKRALAFAIEGEPHIIHCDSDGFDAFTTERGRTEFGLSTNPCTASNGIRNNTTGSHLNGINIRVEDMDENRVLVHIRFHDMQVRHNTRFTGKVQLHDSLVIQPGRTLLLNQSQVFSRLYTPLPRTEFALHNGAGITVRKRGRLVLDGNSTLVLQGDARIYLQKRARLIVHKGSRIIGDEARIIRMGGGRVIYR